MWSSLKVAVLVMIILPNGSMGISQTSELKLRHGKRGVTSVRFMPDGKRFVSAGFDGTVIMWDTRSGKDLWRADLDEGSRTNKGYTISAILGMDLSPDGDTIAVSYSRRRVVGDTLQGKDEERIGLLDSKTGRETKVLAGHTALIGRLAFSPNGELLLSESGDSTARLWNVKTGQEVLLIKLKERGARVAFSPDGIVFAVATQPVYGLPPQALIGLYDARTGGLLREFPRSKDAVTSLGFSPKARVLAIASGDASGAQIDLWQLTAQDPTTTFQMPGREVNALAFSRDGRLLASGGYGKGRGLVEVRDLIASGQVRTFSFGSGVTALDFSPDGRQLVIGTDQGEIVLLSLQKH